MIDIPVYNPTGEQAGTVQVDERLLGGEVRPALLKQAFVRCHANRRSGTAATKGRGQVEGSTRKLYKQKGTGNARRGSIRSNILRGGGRAHPKKPHSYRQDMPTKQRRLANRNALLAKLVDGEVKLIAGLNVEAPSTKTMAKLLDALKIDRSCLYALADTRGPIARSARNLQNIKLTQIDRLNVFDLLNNRYLLADQAAFEQYLDRLAAQADGAADKEAA